MGRLHKRLLGQVWDWVDRYRLAEKNSGVDPQQISVQLRILLDDALLEKRYGEPPIDWAGGCDLQQMNDRRQEYIAALRAADGGDYNPLFRFVGYEGS